MESVERRRNLSRAEWVKAYRDLPKPVIVVDAIEEWLALSKWTPEFFRERFGSKVVKPDGGRAAPTTVAEYVDNALGPNTGKPTPYLRNVNIRREFPELVPDLQPTLRYAEPDRLNSKWLPRNWIRPDRQLELFVGGPGSPFLVLHYDIYLLNNFIAQIYGEKEFFLFPPEQTPYLYPKSHNPKHSMIEDPENPDLKQFPLFAMAKPIRVVLKPGETLFVAPGWWHRRGCYRRRSRWGPAAPTIQIGRGLSRTCAMNEDLIGQGPSSSRPT
jgi:hypothetical protein